jgi:hypothetical protein
MGAPMKTALSRFRYRALRRPAVRKAYDGLHAEFAFPDDVLRARGRTDRQRRRFANGGLPRRC